MKHACDSHMLKFCDMKVESWRGEEKKMLPPLHEKPNIWWGGGDSSTSSHSEVDIAVV
jgi:hypothetical protein